MRAMVGHHHVDWAGMDCLPGPDPGGTLTVGSNDVDGFRYGYAS